MLLACLGRGVPQKSCHKNIFEYISLCQVPLHPYAPPKYCFHWPGLTRIEYAYYPGPALHSLVLLCAFMYEIKYYLYPDENDDIIYIYLKNPTMGNF